MKGNYLGRPLFLSGHAPPTALGNFDIWPRDNTIDPVGHP